MGLGLYYVKTAMEAIGGEILIMEQNDKDEGGAIALIFKD